MRIAMLGKAVVFAVGIAGASFAHAQSHFPDRVFRSGFESVTAAPADDAEAVRFLAQASFGANEADIAQLRAARKGT